MSSVEDHHGNVIELNVCACGAEPFYHSATGLSHEIVCKACGRQTDMQMVGLDAVHAWNAGKIYANASEAPIRSKHL